MLEIHEDEIKDLSFNFNSEVISGLCISDFDNPNID